MLINLKRMLQNVMIEISRKIYGYENIFQKFKEGTKWDEILS